VTLKDRVFIDSNILMYEAGREHSNKESAIKILELISDSKK